ncbi:MAG: orotidine 5'-phosphate decarboxylase [Deltaproteobacteria bacterium]
MVNYSVILAADLPSSREVLSMVDKVGAIVDGVKVAAATVLESGAQILCEIRNIIGQRPLLVDLKIADIGFRSPRGWDGTNAKIIHSLKDSGASHVTVHGFPGPVSIAEAANSARDVGLGVLLLPLMSHAAASLFFSAPVEPHRVVEQTTDAELGLHFPDMLQCKDVTEAILHLGEALNVNGYIGPATRPSDLQRYRSITKRPIWCPGFGRQDRLGRNLEEQFSEWAEIVGPASAAIVGSAIFKAGDPVAAAQEIMEIRDRAIDRSP